MCYLVRNFVNINTYNSLKNKIARRKQHQNYQTLTKLSDCFFFKDKAEIKRLEFDYLLQELPTDQKSILEIADICKY